MIVNGFIKSQDLKISAPLIVSDTFNFLEFRFYFQTKEWDGLTKWAHFKQGNLSYEIPLQEDEIPASEEFSLPPGPWKIYIHGSKYIDGDVTQRITTDEATFMVQRSGCGCGGTLPIVPISVGERLEARIEKLEKGGSGGSGSPGTTFIPHISEDKVLSWTNDGGLENPAPVSLVSDYIIMLDTFNDFPSLEEALSGIIYYDLKKHDGYILSKDRTYWIRVIHEVTSASLEDIPEDELAETVATAAMVKEVADKIDTIERTNDYGRIE